MHKGSIFFGKSINFAAKEQKKMSRSAKIWIECMRVRTLPVSLSGVLIACGLAVWMGYWRWLPAVLCVVFALLAQVASNFANEYFDYLHGADRAGRAGPRRGVTEGDIRPETLRRVTIATIIAAAAVGCCLIPFGGWWLLPVGVVIVLAALAYSAGPYPLSYHGLGEAAVFVFFGLVPVTLTYYVITLKTLPVVWLAAMSIGFLGVNVLLVNNYRDVDDDRAAGKRTSVVIFGRRPALAAYLINGFVAVGLLSPLWLLAVMGEGLSRWTLLVPAGYLVLHTIATVQLHRRDGAALNPLLGATARNMLLFTIGLTIALVI